MNQRLILVTVFVLSALAPTFAQNDTPLLRDEVASFKKKLVSVAYNRNLYQWWGDCIKEIQNKIDTH